MPSELAFSAELERYLSGLQSQGDVALAQATEAQGQLYNENFDPTNPFNRQALLERNLKESAAGDRLRFGGRAGGIYSGGAEASAARQGFEAQRSRDDLFRDYAASMGEVTRGLADKQGALTMSADDAIWDETVGQAGDVESTQGNYGRRRKRRRRG